MDVDEDARIARRVRAGEFDSRGDGRSATGDGELDARHVELRATTAGGGVQGQRLGTEEVVTRGDVGGDLDVETTAAGVDVLGSPVVVVA